MRLKLENYTMAVIFGLLRSFDFFKAVVPGAFASPHMLKHIPYADYVTKETLNEPRDGGKINMCE